MRTASDWQTFGNSLGFIRLILLVDWDPIGVLDYEGAMDEYDTYALKVHDMLCAGASQEELADYLNSLGNDLSPIWERGERSSYDLPLPALAAKLLNVVVKATSP